MAQTDQVIHLPESDDDGDSGPGDMVSSSRKRSDFSSDNGKKRRLDSIFTPRSSKWSPRKTATEHHENQQKVSDDDLAEIDGESVAVQKDSSVDGLDSEIASVLASFDRQAPQSVQVSRTPSVISISSDEENLNSVEQFNLDDEINNLLENTPNQNSHLTTTNYENETQNHHTNNSSHTNYNNNHDQNHRNPNNNQNNRIDLLAVDVDVDLLSDDDIEVLDPEEAAKSGIFNKPQRHISLMDQPTTENSVQNGFLSGRPSFPQHNQPAPVFHSGESNPAQVLRRKWNEMTQYATDLRTRMPKIISDLKLVIEQVQLKARLYNELGADPANAEFRDSIRRQWEVSSQNLNAARATLDQHQRLIAEADRHRDALGLQLQSIGTGISGNPFTTTFGDMIAQQHGSGFLHNVYSTTRPPDDVDLKDLLNNIQLTEIEEEGKAMTPPELSVTLLKHQRIGLSWLLRMEKSKSQGGILADDMGLGKTIQTIALMMAHKSEDPNLKTTLIIAPVSLIKQWAAEIESKLKPEVHLRIGVYHGTSKKDLSTFRKMKKFDVILTSYGTLSSEYKKHYKSAIEEAKVTKNQDIIPDRDVGGNNYLSPFFSKDAHFFRIVLDEAQNIKNKLAIASKAVALLLGKYKFCLSGTPMQNSVDELFPILRFLQIKPYNDQKRFSYDIAIPLKSRSGNYDEMDRDRSLRKLRALLSAILLRRTKETKIDGKPILELPAKHIKRNFVVMDDEEKNYYKALESDIQKQAAKILNTSKKGASSSILTLLLRLRQACIHRFLVEIGFMNMQEKEQAGRKSKIDWRKMYSNAISFDADTLARIKYEVHLGKNVESNKNIVSLDSDDDEDNEIVLKNDIDEENFLTCPVCFNVENYSNAVIFASCGHMICYDCVENFFEDNETSEGFEIGARIASCITCKKSVKEADLIDYDMFHKIHYEGFDVNRIKDVYQVSKDGKTTSKQKLSKLLSDEDGFTPSVKMEQAVDLMKNVFEKHPDEKIIVFSQFTGTFDVMKLLLDHEKIPFLRYDGSMSMEAKNATIKEFYQSDKKVMMLSLKAGNVGLTLTCASHVIIFDPFWNPFVEEQAMDRAYRIGQQREVHVHRILIEGTVESRIMELQEKKKEIIDAALDEKGMQGVSKLGRRELGFLFGLNSLE